MIHEEGVRFPQTPKVFISFRIIKILIDKKIARILSIICPLSLLQLLHRCRYCIHLPYYRQVFLILHVMICCNESAPVETWKIGEEMNCLQPKPASLRSRKWKKAQDFLRTQAGMSATASTSQVRPPLTTGLLHVLINVIKYLIIISNIHKAHKEHNLTATTIYFVEFMIISNPQIFWL